MLSIEALRADFLRSISFADHQLVTDMIKTVDKGLGCPVLILQLFALRDLRSFQRASEILRAFPHFRHFVPKVVVGVGLHIEGFEVDLLTLIDYVLDPTVVVLSFNSNEGSLILSVSMSRAEIELAVSCISMGRVLPVGSNLNFGLFLMILEYSIELRYDIPS